MLFGKVTGVTARLFHSADISELMEEFSGNRPGSASIQAGPLRNRERCEENRQRDPLPRSDDMAPKPARAGR